MAAGRDDFVIAVRSAFLKKGAQQRFSLIALIFFSIGLILLTKFNFFGINYLKISLNEIIYRAAFIASLPEKQIQKTKNLVNDHFDTYSNYKFTLEELENLQAEKYNNDFILAENKRLRELINEYIIKSDELVAKVLLDKDSPFLKSIIVNKGSRDKVELGMAVIDKEYLVGKVVEVNFSTSRVLLISDLNSKIPVSISPGNYQSILSGSGKDFGKIQYFKEDFNLENDSIVYTSGSGGIFRAGIPIGIIFKNSETGRESVDFFSKLSQLTFVKLISFKNMEEKK